MKRRRFLSTVTSAAAGVVAATQLRSFAQAAQATASGAGVVIDPKPLFDISPHLYMQFMEPLGVTDSSVEAAWDYQQDDWRKDFVETTRDLAPGMMRFGGLLSRYYKWREGVGPAAKRPPYRNYVWGGKETHRAGTHEFVDFCRRVGAEPMYCVNFLGDGDKRYANTREGNRAGDAREAADWVSYANDPDHAERKANGAAQPFNLKFWQLGNETSYGNSCFKKDEAMAATIEFARAMRERDPRLKLIGWGDSGWAADLLDRAGEHIDYVAVHMMGQTPMARETVLRGNRYQAEPERAWQELMELIGPRIERKLVELEQTLTQRGSRHSIAINRRPSEPGASQLQPDPDGMAHGRLSRSRDEPLSTPRRDGENLYGGGFQWQPVDHERARASGADRGELFAARRDRNASVQAAQRRAGGGCQIRSRQPGHHRQPNRG